MSAKPKKVTVKKSTVKNDLLNAATALLSEHGQAGASVRAICNAVGVKPPTLYYHYGELDVLHDKAIGQVFAQTYECYKPASEAGDALQSIKQSWELFLDFAYQNPELYKILHVKILAGELPEEVYAAFQNVVSDLEIYASERALKISAEQAVQLIWASASGAATLMAAAHFSERVDVRVGEFMLHSVLAYLLEVSAD